MVAEFESDLIRLRTREGMKVAKAKGRLRGKQPKLNRRQEAHLVSLVHSGEYSTLEVAELFGVGCPESDTLRDGGASRLPMSRSRPLGVPLAGDPLATTIWARVSPRLGREGDEFRSAAASIEV